MSAENTLLEDLSDCQNDKNGVSEEIFRIFRLTVGSHKQAEAPLQVGEQKSQTARDFGDVLQQQQECPKRIFSTGDEALLRRKTGRANTSEQATLAVIPMRRWPGFLDMRTPSERVVMSRRVGHQRTDLPFVSRALPVSNALGGLT